MKNIIIVFLVYFLGLQAEAQNTENTYIANYEVVYRLEYSPDTTNINNKAMEDFFLFIGDNESKFMSKNKWIRDSIKNDMIENFNGSIDIASKNAPKTKFTEIIFKDYKSNKLKVMDRIGRDKFLYSESIRPYNWEVKQDKKVINDFEVQKAVTDYEGRKFIAWFTEEISISQGPYKFEGLPGLIIQLRDTENHYSYQLISFKDIDTKKEIEKFNREKKYIESSKQKFFEAKKQYYANYFKRLKARGISLGLRPQDKRRIQEKFNSRNNPIELQ